MGGAGQVIVESSSHIFVSIHSDTALQRLVSMARRVKDWDDLTCLWAPENFYLGECRVMAGIRRGSTHIRRGRPLV